MGNNDFVDSRSSFEFASFFGSFWSRSSIRYAMTRGYNCYDLGVGTETPEKFTQGVSASSLLVHQYVSSVNPKHFYGFGHGNEDIFSGDNYDIIYQTNSPENSELNGKIVNLLSCATAVTLGPNLVSKYGASAFMGYNIPYGWMEMVPGSLGWSEADIPYLRMHWVWMDWTSMLESLILRGWKVSDAVAKAKARAAAWMDLIFSVGLPGVDAGYYFLVQADADALTLIGDGNQALIPPSVETTHAYDVFPMGTGGMALEADQAQTFELAIAVVCHVDDCDLRGKKLRIYDQNGNARWAGVVENYRNGINYTNAVIDVPAGVVSWDITFWTIECEGDSIHPQKTVPLVLQGFCFAEVEGNLIGGDEAGNIEKIEGAAAVILGCWDMEPGNWGFTDADGHYKLSTASFEDGFTLWLSEFGPEPPSPPGTNCFNYYRYFGNCTVVGPRCDETRYIPTLKLPKIEPLGDTRGALFDTVIDSCGIEPAHLTNVLVRLFGEKSKSGKGWHELARAYTDQDGFFCWKYTSEEWDALKAEWPYRMVFIGTEPGNPNQPEGTTDSGEVLSHIGGLCHWNRGLNSYEGWLYSIDGGYHKVVPFTIKSVDQDGNPFSVGGFGFDHQFGWVMRPWNEGNYYPYFPYSRESVLHSGNSTVLIPTGWTIFVAPKTNTTGDFKFLRWEGMRGYFDDNWSEFSIDKPDQSITAVYMVNPTLLWVLAAVDDGVTRKAIEYPDQPTADQVELEITDASGNVEPLPYNHTPLRTFLPVAGQNAGDYTITAKYGDQILSQSVTLMKGQSKVVWFIFKPISVTPPLPDYALSFSGDQVGIVLDVGTRITFRGTLRQTSTSSPIAGATIQLLATSKPVDTTTTDANGEFTFSYVVELKPDSPPIYYMQAYASDQKLAVPKYRMFHMLL